MHSLTATVLAVLFATLVLVSATESGPVPETSNSRTKRQSADVRTAEYLAWIALGGRVPSAGCVDVACGVVDVYSSGKKKRADYNDEQRYQLLKNLIERAAENNMAQ